MTTKVIGRAPCLLCGSVTDFKQNEKGRMSVVCRWQDGGCGSQFQALSPVSVEKLEAYMRKHSKPGQRNVTDGADTPSPKVATEKPEKEDDDEPGFKTGMF